MALLLAAALAPSARAQSRPLAPRYTIDARVDVGKHSISATMRVELEDEDARPRESWWFHLAPNRFLNADARSAWRASGSIPFGYSYLSPVKQDPMLPEGFSIGSIEIVSVEDESGRRLPVHLEENPAVALGFSIRDALMRVEFVPESTGRTVVIRFVTHLPHRHWDGWSDMGVYAEEWYPRLLPFRDGEWTRDPAVPSPAWVEASVSSSRRGWMVMPDMAPAVNKRETPVARPSGDAPVRTFPVIFLEQAQAAAIERSGVQITSLYTPGTERIGGLLLDVGEGALEFMEENYGLAYPKRHLTFVPGSYPDGDQIAADGIVVLPQVDYRNSTVLDRVLVGRTSRSIAEQWFGETVWSNEDREGWLIWGISGYVALEFFDRLYGWDAPTHSITDWLAPRYREHYFEEPVRRLDRLEMDHGLPISLWRYPKTLVSRIVVHHKAPLVVRQLEYVVGTEDFHAALRAYFEKYRHAQATSVDFQQAVERSSRRDLSWYFHDWVYGTSELDVALGKIVQEPTRDGWRVEAIVRRKVGGRMPVQVMAEDENGNQYLQRWEGIDPKGTVVFDLPTRMKRIVLDPREHLMESERQNNYSDANVRVRPLFDWSKNREILVSLQGRAGGNAIDGNYVGLGVQVVVDDQDTFLLIPGYGMESQELIYEASWIHDRFLFPRLSLGLRRSRIGGRDFTGLSFSWRHDTPDHASLVSTLEFRKEHVDATPPTKNTTATLQSPGDVNNINLLEEGFIQLNGPTYHSLTLELEHSEKGYGSDFEYSLERASLLNGLQLSYDHVLELELIRGGIDGNAPIQKKFLLGDPLVLRGYPRTLKLVTDQLFAARLDYRYVLMRGVHGREVQMQKLTGILFVDIGKGWRNGQDPADVRQRQDYGLGIEVEVNLVRQVTFPIRVEVARPYNDPEYKDTQYIFFQALAFF